MGRVAYHAVAEEIANILLADPTLAARAVRVVVDEGNALGPELCPFVNVRPARRDLPVAIQPIAAHTVARFLVTYTLECWEFSLDGMAHAARLRDELLGDVEIALLRNASLNQTVAESWLNGGTFLESDQDNLRGGTVDLVADVRATTS